MFKNNKGITISALVVTVVVLVILAGVSLESSSGFLTKMRISKLVSSMELVRSKARNNL